MFRQVGPERGERAVGIVRHADLLAAALQIGHHLLAIFIGEEVAQHQQRYARRDDIVQPGALYIHVGIDHAYLIKNGHDVYSPKGISRSSWLAMRRQLAASPRVGTGSDEMYVQRSCCKTCSVK